MITFGERLRRERESRNKTLEDLSGTTGIGLSYLQALEHNEFDALPGRSFGKLYIRAYAKVLGFDPRPLIAEYDRQRQSWEQDLPPEARVAKPVVLRPTVPVGAPEVGPDSAAADDDAPGVEPEAESPGMPEGALRDEPAAEQLAEDPGAVPVELPHSPEVREETPVEEARPESPVRIRKTSPSRRTTIVLGAAVVAFVAVAVWIFSAWLPDGHEPGPVASEAGFGEAPAPPSPGADEATRESRAAEPPVEPVGDEAPLPAVRAPTSGGTLTVDDFGVGRRMVRRRLDGRDDRFREGELVWFSTRVLGGSRGDSIVHVWLRDGKPVQSIELAVDGPHWRTHSNKTLWGLGAWSVEARDPDGRVLATASFTCAPRRP